MSTSKEFRHPTLGTVRLSLRADSRRFSARWRDGKLYFNAPAEASRDEIMGVLAKLEPKMLAARPTLSYAPGQTISLPDLSILVKQQTVAPKRILGTAANPLSSIEVGSEWDFNDQSTTLAISDIACKIARKLAPQLLLPRARQIAERVGRTPSGWTISRGHRVLGHCDSKGVIALSYAMVFLPQELRDYIVCHELAHLSEMNHGPRFHQLCDAYCGGQEAILAKKLRAFQWPILRK